ncbi:hypothetical protein ACON3F_04875 [Providencia hangzhouensis]|uniref:hypothetical protein n=1 Tax=Providencia TaxID=586 RepID=UPI001A22717B|nr:hypothetical protein [Providencia sp. PROV099]WOB96883.1 hypothetical protein P3L54_08785 [Providencia sp. PROV099]
MTQESLNFKIHNSFFIETMHATLLNRLDKILIFLQIVLGSAVFASYGNTPLFGFLITVLAVISFVWQPSKAAFAHDLQAKKMKLLITNQNTFTEIELLKEYSRAEETDNPTIGLLLSAAHKRALIATGYNEEARKIKLTKSESITAWLAGDLPPDTPSDDTPHI